MKKVLAILLAIVLVVSGVNMNFQQTSIEAATVGIKQTDFIKANGKFLRTNYGYGETVYLRGTNAGGLTVQEFWMCPTTSTTNVNDQYEIWSMLTQRFGEENARTLVKTYIENYWTESDFDKCASLGMNCIRLPLWYRDFVDSNNNWYSDAFDWVDWFVAEAGERGMYVILDMHGAYGSQNGSDHSGVDGGDNKIGASQFFFGDNAADNQEKYYQMWEKIAAHFNGNPIVAGYDLLNEPFCTYRYSSGYSDDYLHSLLWGIYDQAYDRIRNIDTDHVIIMEATWDSWDLPNPSDYGWSNVMYEYHQYEYSDYDNASGTQISSMQNKINNIFSANYNVPSYMGEFCYFNNLNAWSEGLQLLNNNNLNWTSWTYKCVSEYGNWGLVNQSVDKVNVETDSYDTILSKWSNVGSSYDNTNLQNVFKQYTPGSVYRAEDHAATTVIDEGKYYLNCNNYVVCAENSGNDPLVANRESYSGAWETLHLIKNGDGTVSFKSDINGKYVQANVYDYCQLIASSDSIGDWEKFYLVNITGYQYGIISYANGKYVKADFNDSNSGVLKATGTSIGGAWEAFTFNKVGDTSEETTETVVETTEVVTETTKVEESSSQEVQTTTTVVVDTKPSAPIGLTYAGNEALPYYFAWQAVEGASGYNVYVNNAYIGQTAGTAYNIDSAYFDNAGDYNISVTTVNASGVESDRTTITYTVIHEATPEEPTTEAKPEIVISDNIKVEGYQISSTYGGSRVVGSVEDTINGKKVTSWGYVYGLANYNGQSTGITESDMIVEANNDYVTYYQSTAEGTSNKVLGDSKTATYFVRTMKFVGQVASEYTAKYYVRAYAILEDGSYVYSNVNDYAIYDIADYIYQNKMMNNNAGHEYLYNNILTVVKPEYKEVEYDWSNIVVKF